MSKGPYETLIGIFARYRADYGGFYQLLGSPFLHIAILFGLISWLFPGGDSWQSTVLASFPTILGFSLAAYTLTFAMMGSNLHNALSNAVHPEQGVSLLRIMNATFFHVVFIQTSILIYASISKSTILWSILVDRKLIGECGLKIFKILSSIDILVGHIVLYYGMTLMISVVIAMFRLGTIAKR